MDRSWLKSAFKLRLSDIFSQDWKTNLNTNSLCTSYKMFKDSLHFENNLVNMDLKTRTNLARFRCRSHNLPVCANRFKTGATDSIICPLCDTNDIGDEFHYLFKCTFFDNARLNTLNLGTCASNSHTYIEMMSQPQGNYDKNICTFIGLIMYV